MLKHTYNTLREEFKNGALLFDPYHRFWYPVHIQGTNISKTWLGKQKIQLYVKPVAGTGKAIWVAYSEVRTPRTLLAGETGHVA